MPELHSLSAAQPRHSPACESQTGWFESRQSASARHSTQVPELQTASRGLFWCAVDQAEQSSSELHGAQAEVVAEHEGA
jgi:hypothetical protein